MNRLGLSADDVNGLRKVEGLVDWDKDTITGFHMDKLDVASKAKLERALRRAVRDTVLKGNALDAPEFLTQIFGSHAVAKALFQFMRFPSIAYNKLGRKMYHNFDAQDAAVATATGAMILGTITQMKDIGREEPRYDLSTKKGQMNSIGYIIERMPHLAFAGLVQSQVDIIGRLTAKGFNEEYKSYPSGANLGVTWDRLNDLQRTGQRIIDGSANEKDIMTFKSFLSTNLFWLQPINNIANDAIKNQ